MEDLRSFMYEPLIGGGRGCVDISELWNSGIRGKLECYSIPKLQKLARTKNMKKFYYFTKKQLVDELEKISLTSDFPIK